MGARPGEPERRERRTRRRAAREGVGDGLRAIAGEVQEFVVRLPPRPLRSPPRKVVRRTSVGGARSVLTGPLEGLKGGRVGSWSAAEHLVFDRAKLSCYGHVERGFGNEDSRGNASCSPAATMATADSLSSTSAASPARELSVELAGGGHIDGSPLQCQHHRRATRRGQLDGHGRCEREIVRGGRADVFRCVCARLIGQRTRHSSRRSIR